MEAWCASGNGQCTELWASRWLCYRTGLMPPMWVGGQEPAPELFACAAPPVGQAGRDATDRAREAAEDLASAQLREESSLFLGPPRELVLPAVAVLLVCALAFLAHWASIAWEALGLRDNARIEL